MKKRQDHPAPCAGKQPRTRTFGIFFPFWFICFNGIPWLITTLAVTLLLDSALLIAVLLIFGSAEGGVRGGDVGNVWRRKILPFYLCDLAASFAGGGVLLLASRFLPGLVGTDTQYYLMTLSQRPFTDLRTMLPLLAAVIMSGALVYLSASRLLFRSWQKGKRISLALAIFSAPYSLLIPTLFVK